MSSEREKQFLGGKRYVSRRCTSENLPFSVSLPVAWASAPCGEVKTLSDERGARPSCGSVRCRDCAAEARLLRQQERTTESEVGMPLTKNRSASLGVTQRLTAGNFSSVKTRMRTICRKTQHGECAWRATPHRGVHRDETIRQHRVCHRVSPARQMAVAIVRECRLVGLVLRGMARFAREDEDFAYRDEHCCNENEPPVAFHTCLRECCLPPFSARTLSVPRRASIAAGRLCISKEMFLTCRPSNAGAQVVSPANPDGSAGRMPSPGSPVDLAPWPCAARDVHAEAANCPGV